MQANLKNWIVQNVFEKMIGAEKDLLLLLLHTEPKKVVNYAAHNMEAWAADAAFEFRDVIVIRDSYAKTLVQHLKTHFAKEIAKLAAEAKQVA